MSSKGNSLLKISHTTMPNAQTSVACENHYNISHCSPTKRIDTYNSLAYVKAFRGQSAKRNCFTGVRDISVAGVGPSTKTKVTDFQAAIMFSEPAMPDIS